MTKDYKENNHLISDKPKAMSVFTASIVEEFTSQVDSSKEYDLKTLKQLLTQAYNVKNGKKSAKKPAVAKKVASSDDTSSSDEDKSKKRGRPTKVKLDKDGNPKAKKAPSAYNNYVKEKIMTLKKENPEIPAKELMAMAAVSWKTLTQEEKDAYKTVKSDDDQEE